MNKFFNFKFLFIFFTILFLIPLWTYEFLPFVDHPQHLGMAHILQKLSDTTLPYNEYFGVKPFPTTHILHVLLVYIFSFFVPLEIAGKIFISLYITLLPLSIFYLIKVLNGNRYLSLFAFLFIYNYSLIWGFAAYCLGISLFFLALSLILKNVIDGKKNTIFPLSFLFLTVFLTHGQVYIFLLATFLIILIFAYRINLFKILKKSLMALPSLIFFIPWSAAIIAMEKKTVLKDIGEIFPRWERFLIFKKNYLTPSFLSDDFVLGMFILLFIFVKIKGWKAVRPFVIKDKKIFIIYLLIFLSIACYFMLPSMFGGYFSVYQRFGIFIPLFLIVLMSKVEIKRKMLLKFAALTLIFVTFSGLMITFSRFNQYAKPIRRLLAKTEERKKMVELYYPESFESPVNYHAFLHFACYYMIRKNGLAGYTFPYFQWHFVTLKKDYLKRRINSWQASKSIFPSGWEEFDYFLVCGSPPAKEEKYYKNLKMIDKIGIWALYERGSLL